SSDLQSKPSLMLYGRLKPCMGAMATNGEPLLSSCRIGYVFLITRALKIVRNLLSKSLRCLLTVRALLNTSSRRLDLPTRAACCVAHSRDSHGYHCGLCLAYPP